MSDCIFCKIRAGEIPAEIVYEDDHVIAFKDINPQAPVHALVIPREHIVTMHEINDETLSGKIFNAVAKTAEKLGVTEKGYRVVVNNGSDGGQEVGHLHVHILAGRPMTWPPG